MKTLKKLGVVMALILAFAGTANAKIINFGIKAGMNVNKISLNKNAFKNIVNPDNSIGWEAGVMAEINVPLVGLCFDASLMYARMNNSTHATVDGEEFISKQFGKNFLQIPVNIKYKFQLPVVSSFFAPYIFTGPEFAFRLDKNTWSALKTQTCQVAWNIGLGFQFVNHLQIGASYGFGLNNALSKNIMGVNNPVELKAKNNYWTVTAAYLF